MLKKPIEMSTYVLMKILESVPNRYDKGIRILTLGTLNKAYDRLTASIHEGQQVLDIGCGTGALTMRAARKGAKVKGIDVNAQILEIAQKQANEAGIAQNIEFCEMGIAELANDAAGKYDVVMSALCFSELDDNELFYALKEIKRIMKPGGSLLIADEVMPKGFFRRMLHRIIRFPLVIITYLITQTTTHAVKDLTGKIKQADMRIESVRLNRLGNFIELKAGNPAKEEK